MLQVRTIIVAALSLTWALAASANHIPIGSEFRVNTATTGAQVDPAVASDLDGTTVVVWAANQHIYGQRYNAGGTPLGSEFQVDALPIPMVTSFARSGAQVATDDDGDFVVAWETFAAQDDGQTFPISEDIVTRRYSSAGTPLDAVELSVRSCATSAFIAPFACDGHPALAADGDGDFIVAYRDGYTSLSARRYDSSGVAQGSPFAVSTDATALKMRPNASAATDGRFVVVWTSLNQDASGYGIFGQRFDSAGAMAGTEFQVNTFTTGRQHYPIVAAETDGDFVVVWESAQDGSNLGVFGQRYDSVGTALDSEFQINSTTTADQRAPGIDVDGGGNFVVVWRSFAQDGDDYGVFGRVFDSGGAAHGTEFQVNTYTTGEQGGTFTPGPLPGVPGPFAAGPRVAAAADGDFIVTWRSEDQDGSSFGVYAQRFGVTEGSDPFKCYQGTDLRNPKFIKIAADTADQLTTESVEVQKIKFHCAAVDINGAGVNDPNRRLTCYQIKGTTFAPRPAVEVTTQFQTSRFEIRKPKLLCVPSIDTPLP